MTMMLDYFHATMPKTTAKTTLYKLIEAGFLARQALLVPLASLGLEQGDDAIILSLSKKHGISLTQLAERTGLPETALEMRLARLEVGGKLTRRTLEANEAVDIFLTEDGAEAAKALHDHWQRLEEALIGELDHKDSKKLKRVLKRFTQLLQL